MRCPKAAGPITLLACSAAILCASVAQAATWCVGEPACVGTKVAASGAGLQEALTAAGEHANSGGPDAVLIGPGTFTRTGGFSYGGDAVTIRGAGAGATKLERDALSAHTVFLLNAPSGSVPSLSALTIRLPTVKDDTGLDLIEGFVEGVSIESPAGAEVSTGLGLGGGVFAAGTIDIPSGTAVEGGHGEVRDSTLRADPFVTQAATGAVFRRDRIFAAAYGVLAYYPASLLVEDSLIDLTNSNGPGVSIVGNSNGSAKATLRSVTIVHGGPASIGIESEGNAKASSTVSVTDSVISGVTHPLYEVTVGAGSKASISTSYTALTAAGNAEATAEGGTKPAPPVETNPLTATPLFVSPLTGVPGEGDWREQPGSPLIDAGTPGELAAGESSTDLNGNPRLVHGRRDVGAFEYGWRAPAPSASASSQHAIQGEAITFKGSATLPEAGDTVSSYRWKFDDGQSASGAETRHAFSTLGTHTAVLTVTDTAGLSAAASASVEVGSLPCVSASAPVGCPGCGPCLARAITSLALKPSRFRASSSGPSIPARGGVTRIKLRLAFPAHVKFTVVRLGRGVRSGKRCLPSGRGHHGKPCTRRSAVKGSFSVSGHAGPNNLRFSGRMKGARLAPGRYLLVATAAGSAVSVPFTVLR